MKKVMKYSPAYPAFIQSKRLYLIPLLILTLVFFAYMPSLKNQFTNWDDPEYVLSNPMINNLSSENIKRIFSEYWMGNYHPLTMLSLSLDYYFGNLEPANYHRTNLILHLANTLLVFIFVYLLFQKNEIATIVSVLFGVHTIHVESVAWVSERKDVLYTFFFLFSLILYLRYVKEDKTKFYWFSLVLFFLSILSKGMAVSFTISLITIDFFLGRNLKDKKVILEKIPFLILSVIFGIVAIIAQGLDPNAEGIAHYNIFLRLIFACYGFVNYFIKLILPFNLSPFYPYPDRNNLSLVFWLCPFIALGIAGLIIYSLRKRKDIFFGFSFFLINVFLVLQLLPVGRAIMADRYVYIPSVGFFIMIAAGYQWLVEKNPPLKAVLIGVLSAYAILLSILTYQHSKVWMDGISLWKDALKKNPSDVAYNKLGAAYVKPKEYQKAMEYFNKAIVLNPEYSQAYNNRAAANICLHRYEAAIPDFDKAIALNPEYSLAYVGRGVAKLTLKKYEASISDFNNAISLDPAQANFYYNRGSFWYDINKPDKALADYDKALSIDPFYTGALNDRGLIKRRLKDYEGAMKDFNKAISIDPLYVEAYANRALVKYDLADYKGAQIDNEKALSLNSDFTSAYLQSGNARFMNKDYKGALSDFSSFINRNSNSVEAYFKRAISKFLLGDNEGALEDYNMTIMNNPSFARAYQNRAELKYNMGMKAAACEDWKKAVELGNESSKEFLSKFCK
jgi:protein O-mannosyl-transferase